MSQLFFVEIAWLLLGAVVVTKAWRSVEDRKLRAHAVAFVSVVVVLPVAWSEGRWVYWSLVQPRNGERIEEVERRLGRASPWAESAAKIRYLPPGWWLVPGFGQIVLFDDGTGRVERWDVSWR